MIAPAPLSSWRGLLAAALRPPPSDDALAAPWKRGGERAAWFSRGAWALAALAENIGLGLGRRARVWLPDYFCNQSTWPLRRTGATLVHYPIDMELGPDWAACEAMAGREPPDLFVLAHYFGEPNDAAAARAFCDRAGAALLEDAAHGLPGPGIGEFGDYVLYCPRKMLAVPDGAVLLGRNEPPPAAVGDAPSPWAWLAKQAARKFAPGLRRGPGPHFLADAETAPLAPTPALGGLARRLLAEPGLEDAIDARKRNADALRAAWAGADGCAPLFPEPKGAPYRFVLRCVDAQAAFDALASRGCPAETWPDLAPEVLADPDRHAAAVALRRSLVLIPTHQSTPRAALRARCGRPE